MEGNVRQDAERDLRNNVNEDWTTVQFENFYILEGRGKSCEFCICENDGTWPCEDQTLETGNPRKRFQRRKSDINICLRICSRANEVKITWGTFDSK